ncbi:MAG: hypothetical protein CME70_02535 [Halobacteriovorax sp.]|nr:hypothetical protein [Halobacteriovorax sp.]|tara:strand:- start:11908 stop:12312 length:405 start_codon:yes stop_codon:yes gene_type:complete
MDAEKIIQELEKVEELGPGDFVSLEQYGGGPDESNLVGTKNGLIHLALNIFLVSQDKAFDESVLEVVKEDSVAGIHWIEKVETKEGKVIDRVYTFKDRLRDVFWISVAIIMLASMGYGFVLGVVGIVNWLRGCF